MHPDWIAALIGGTLIGIATLMLMVFNGRVAGISGIVGRLIDPRPQLERAWLFMFLLGLFIAGLLTSAISPDLYPSELPRSTPQLIIAGLLVGVGTQMGSGCTSGHGICGLSRFSKRSMVATVSFMAAGMITVAALHAFTGGIG